MTDMFQNQPIERPGMIDLGRGHPGLELLPLTLMRQAAEQRFTEPNAAFLQYGSEQGELRFRLALAAFLGLHYGVPVDPSTLLVTNGASSALQLICTLFTKPGDTVLVEEPSYFLALRIFADHHLNVIGIPLDDKGLRTDMVEAALQRVRPAFLYTVPTFQNPTGITLSAERRAELIALSSKYDLLIVADEVYHLLSYQHLPPTPLATHLGVASVISMGSFSKILAPGLRLGWIQAPPLLLQRFIAGGMLQSGGGLNPFTSALVASALESGQLGTHLDFLKHSYRERAAAMSQALVTLAERVRYRNADGGFFVWLELTTLEDAEQLLEVPNCDVNFQLGKRFSSTNAFRNFLRLSFSYYCPEKVTSGVQKLGRLLERSGLCR